MSKSLLILGALNDEEIADIRILSFLDEEKVMALFRAFKALRSRVTRVHCEALFSLVHMDVDDGILQDTLAWFRDQIGGQRHNQK